MAQASASPVIADDALEELVAGACALVTRERDAPEPLHFASRLRELGRALGYPESVVSSAGPGEADVVWARSAGAATRFLIRRALAASQVLKALPVPHEGRSFMIVTDADGVTEVAIEAVRKVVPLSRPGLRRGEAAVVWAPAGGCGRVLFGDLAADVIAKGRLIDVSGSSEAIAANPGRDARDFPLFPHPKLRDGQRALMRDARAALESRKILVAHAPTGIGKTAAVLSVAVEHALRHGKTVFFLTSRQTQHKIAVDTLRRMSEIAWRPLRVVDLISKQSMCAKAERPDHSGAFYEWCAHLCQTRRCTYFLRPTERARTALLDEVRDVTDSVRMSAKMGCCPHKVAVEAACEADVVVCDYNVLFDPQRRQTAERIARSPGDLVVIVDEAHNLPERIREASRGRITHALLGEAVGEMERESPELAFALKQLLKVFESLVEAAPAGEQVELAAEALTDPLLRAISTSLVPLTYDQLVDDLKKAGRKVVVAVEGRSATLEVVSFLEAWKQPEKDTLRLAERGAAPAVTITLLDPSTVACEIFASFDSAILMSGTLYPMGIPADLLGIPQERRRLESYPSPFLASRRRVLLVRGVSTRFKDRGGPMFARIAAAVEATARSTPGNVAVFFPSYKLRDDIGALLPRRLKGEMIVETREMKKGEKDRIVARLTRLRERGGALMLGVLGGSFSEGVDFYGGILQAVVVVGLPLAPPSREVDTLIAYFEGKFGRSAGETYAYLNPAITKVLQASGRLIRREEDRGVVVLIDERLEQERYRRLLPPDFCPEAVEGPDELACAVAAFFGDDP